MGVICKKGAFVIVPTQEVTEEMLNEMRKDFNVQGNIESNSLRKSTDGTQSIIIFKNLTSTVFISYRWFSYNEILIEMSKPEWVEEQ